MTDDELQAIKARAERWADAIEMKDPMSRLVYEDVRVLVAEVERLQAIVIEVVPMLGNLMSERDSMDLEEWGCFAMLERLKKLT